MRAPIDITLVTLLGGAGRILCRSVDQNFDEEINDDSVHRIEVDDIKDNGDRSAHRVGYREDSSLTRTVSKCEHFNLIR